MQHVAQAGAWCNGEVAYLAWDMAQPLPDCLGFTVTRVHETGADAGQRRLLPTWLAFSDQSDPQWIEQDSSVRSCVIAKTFARESAAPVAMKLSRNRLPRPQDKECVPPATPSFGRVSIVTNKYQTRTEVHGFVVAAI